jgi:hypothetical protein
MMEKMSLAYDAFSNGQVQSKLWLCETLEEVNHIPNPTIWILGGWYGIQGFLLLSRNNIDIKEIRSFDADPECQPIADKINNNWEIQQWKFKALTQDCNTLDYTNTPDIVINTSTEHFDSIKWFDNIPSGTLVCLQGNNMNHEDHSSECESLDDFVKSYNLTDVKYVGEKEFSYPTWSFKRFMLIGTK